MSRRGDMPGSMPLKTWGDELRHRRRVRRRLLATTGFVAAGIFILAPTIVRLPAPRFVWNASASAPIGLYSVTPGALIHVGDMVVARPPKAVRQLAADRHYLPLDVPLVKRIAAGPGDKICAKRSIVTIDGRPVVVRRSYDLPGRPLPGWSGCRWLRDGQYLLLMAGVSTSFDGRYFGVTTSVDIIGRARLLWER